LILLYSQTLPLNRQQFADEGVLQIIQLLPGR